MFDSEVARAVPARELVSDEPFNTRLTGRFDKLKVPSPSRETVRPTSDG